MSQLIFAQLLNLGVVEVRQVDGYPILYHPIKSFETLKRGSGSTSTFTTGDAVGDKDDSQSQPELRYAPKNFHCHSIFLIRQLSLITGL